MKIKVSEATPLQLDYMVGYALGLVAKLHGVIPFSTNWAQGGPIIEREYIELTTTNRSNAEIWEAIFPGRGEDSVMQYGPTPLVAAMRCYVASKMGDEVEIPGELTA